MESKRRIFIISLDFELYWGIRDKRTIADYGKNLRNVHQVVPALLECFQRYGIHATWATVGCPAFHSTSLHQYSVIALSRADAT